MSFLCSDLKNIKNSSRCGPMYVETQGLGLCVGEKNVNRSLDLKIPDAGRV